MNAGQEGAGSEGKAAGGNGNTSQGADLLKTPWPFLMTGLRLIALLVVLIATVQLYLTIQDIIRMWVSPQFIPLVTGIYFVIVIVGGVWLIRASFTK